MAFRKPGIFGIVNITRDSFSDGGRFLSTENAVQQAMRLYNDGAYAIDLGPASSHPDAESVSPGLEIERLSPVVKALQDKNIPISIDSYHTETQRYGISENVAFLNDIQGFPFPEFYQQLADADCRLIVMHSVQRIGAATRVHVKPDSIVDMILDFFSDRINSLTAAGADKKRLILDPGMGFFLGNDPEASFAVLKNLPLIRETFDLPLLVSVSRKSFLRKVTGRDVNEAGAVTLAAEIILALREIDYIRTHDVRALNDALTIIDKLQT
jgi:dihydropteroate synthase